MSNHIIKDELAVILVRIDTEFTDDELREANEVLYSKKTTSNPRVLELNKLFARINKLCDDEFAISNFLRKTDANCMDNSPPEGEIFNFCIDNNHSTW